MDMANDQSIREILNGIVSRRCRATVAAPRPDRRKSRCKCGQCRPCLDNARWERIFNEKFSDPDYYSYRPGPRGCSLSWLK
jgi:hypothetical protein